MSIASEITRLQNDSAAIAAAIAAKGVTVPSGSGYDDYARLIGQISGGGGGSTGYPAWLKDGDTHLWIEIANSYQLTQTIRIRMIGTIDWGDGTTTSANVTTYTTFTHTYSTVGKYRIDLHPTSGTFYLGGASSSYCVMGSVTAKYRHRVTSLYQAEIGTGRITTISNYTFYNCYGLLRVYVPDTITTIGSSAFNGCFSMREIEFDDPSTITSTSFSSTFAYNYCLRKLNFTPPGPTSFATTFRGCRSLTELVIPSTVTDIAANTFYDTYSLQKMYCFPATPPTVADENAFKNFNADCTIYVPNGKLTAYQTANIWSTFASQMVEM